MIVGEVLVKYSANAAGLIQGTQQATASINQLHAASVQGASGLQRMSEVAAGIGIYQVLTKASSAVVAFGRDAVATTARVEEMNKVLGVLGRNSGQTSGQIDTQTAAIKKLGIETDVAQRTLAEFMRNGLKAADAAKVARVAQDAAVVSGANSSQALDSIMHGIVTRQTQVLRNAGITVSLDSAFQQAAAAAKKSVEALTEQEKTQAALNAVVREGVSLEGAYESSMTSASKQLRSRARYVTELKESLGTMGAPIYSAWVFGVNDLIKVTGDAFGASGPLNKAVSGYTTVVGLRMAQMFGGMKAKASDFIENGGMNKVTEKLKDMASAYSGTGGVAAGGLAGIAMKGGSGLLSQVAGGTLGSMFPVLKFALPPGLSQAVTIFSMLVASSKEFRDSLVELGQSIMASAGILINAFAPVMQAIQDMVDAIAPSMAKLVKAIAALIPAAAVVAGAIIQATAPLIKIATVVIVPLVSAFASLIEAIANTKVAIVAFGAVAAIYLGGKFIGYINAAITAYKALASAMAAARMAELGGGAGNALARFGARAGSATGVVGSIGNIATKFAGPAAAATSGVAAAGAGAGAAGAGGAAAGAAGIGTAAAVALPIVAALAVGVVAWKLYSNAQERATKHAYEFVSAKSKEGAVLADGSTDLAKQIENFRGIREEYTRLNGAFKAGTGPDPGFMNNYVDGIKKMYKKEILPAEVEYAAKSVSTAQDRIGKIKDAQKLLAAQLQIAPETFNQVATMLPSQLQMVNDQLNQMVENTKSWKMEAMSGASALKEAWSNAQNVSKITGSATSINTKDLQGVMAGRVVGTSGFMANIDQLVSLGGGKVTSFVTELLKAGPEQAGDALQSWMSSLAQMPKDEAKKAVESITEYADTVAKSADLALRDLAVKLLSGSLMATNNTDSLKEAAKTFNDTGENIRTNSAIVGEYASNRTELGYTSAGTKAGPVKSPFRQQVAADELNKLVSSNAAPEKVAAQAQVVEALAQQALESGKFSYKTASGVEVTKDLTEDTKKMTAAVRDSAIAIRMQYAAYTSASTEMNKYGISTEKLIQVETLRRKSASYESLMQSAMGGKPKNDEEKKKQQDLVASLPDDLKKLYAEFSNEKNNYGIGTKAGVALVAGLQAAIASGNINIATALAPVDSDMTKIVQSLISAENAFQTSTKQKMDDNLNKLNAAIHAYQTLGQAVDAVFSRQAAATTGMGSISSASLKAAESLGSGISQGRNLRAVHDELATSMVAGVQAIKSHVMALAEARQIGRDAASVQAEMTRQFDEFRGMLYADTAEWLKNNQARLASQSVTEELAKTSGILKTALQANDAATNASVGAQTRLAIAINSVAKNSTVAFATQSDLRAKTIAFTDAIEQQAYALAAQGVIGKDVQSIYGYITDRVNEMIVAMKGQTSAVLTADDALKAFGDTWETTVGIQRGVTQSQWAVDEAMRALTKTYIDYSGVATSTNVTADAQSYAWAKLGGSLDGVVESLRKQAAAMVQAGQMDSSPAAMSEWITKQLTALRASKPVLAGEINKYIANINKIAPTVATQAELYTDQAITQLTDYLTAVGNVPPEKRTTMIVLVDEAYGIIDDFQFALDSIPNEEVRIDAVWNAEKLRAGMNETLAESATKITQFTSALQFLQGGGQYVRNAEAIGAALTYGYNVDPNKFRVLPEGLPSSLISFAMGGIEDHSPHIARGGDWRVFAEPETGGEAYIPLSISKRPRSEQLLKQVASMFGGNYVANAAGNVFAGSAELDMTSSIGGALAGATKGAVDIASFFAALTFAKKLEGISGARNNVASGGGRERAGGPSEYNEPFAQMLFQKAAGFIGTPYLWGGTSLEGIDCSGFTQAVWKQLGVDLSRTTSTQLRQGTAISPAQARPGDQLFFGTDPNYNDDQHTGFVFDPAKRLMLDASQGAVGVHNWDGYGNVIGYRRYYADGAVVTPDHVRTYDSGGVLKPGYTMAYNGTGKDEYVTTNDGQGPGGGTTIEQLHVHTNVPPQEWLDEAQWRRAKGYGL